MGNIFRVSQFCNLFQEPLCEWNNSKIEKRKYLPILHEVPDGLLQSICFWMFCSKHSITFENTYLLSCWFHCVDIFYIKFRFRETFTVINSVTRILLIETLYKFRTIMCWFTLCKYKFVKFKCFVCPASISCVSHSIHTCTVAIKSIRNMHAVSTNQIADILHFNDNYA